MSGKNKGKKYIKLKGNEIARPQDEARAQRFMRWYGKNCRNLHKFVKDFDQDTAHDVALHVYERMAFTGLKPKDNTAYYLQAYRNAIIKRRKDEAKYSAVHVSLSMTGWRGDDEDEQLDIAEPDYRADEYEAAFAEFEDEVLDYVRENFDELSVSLFEIYVALQPATSYQKLARMLGLKWWKVWPLISAIRKDVAQKFGERRINLISV